MGFDLTDVDPLIGTDSDFYFSNGNTLPLITRPHGMVNWSPQTSQATNWFFSPRGPKLQGLRLTHQPSPWIGDYGHFTLMVQTGPVVLDPRARASAFRGDDTTIAPHRFEAFLLRYGLRVELVPTEHGGLLRIRPPDGCDELRLIIDQFSLRSRLSFDREAKLLLGHSRANSGGVPEGFACHFALRCSHPVTRFHAVEVDPATTATTGSPAGYIEIETEGAREVLVEIGTSFIGEKGAVVAIRQELEGQTPATLNDQAAAEWRELLGRVQIEGASRAQRRTFYTALYRALCFPRRWYESGDGGKVRHYSPYDGSVRGGVLFADNGFWETHRTVYPLLALLYPDRLSPILDGWLNAYREGGWLPKWSSPGHRARMVGTHADAVFADAISRGVDGFSREAAHEAVYQNASRPGDPGGRFGRLGLARYEELGYVPADEQEWAVSRTLDFAYGDFCASQIAEALGERGEAQRLRRRSLSYREVFDPEVGFFRGRLADGRWQQPFDPCTWGGPFIEGSAWHYLWAVPHDPAGLARLHGGPDRLVARLEEMLATEPTFRVGTYGREIHEMTEMALAGFGQYAHCNQPVHHALYLFAAAGRPDLTQHWVRRVLNELYNDSWTGLPGDEDNGEMSAWYVLSALGLYPLCPGDPSWVLGSPLFERAELQLPGERRLVIEAPGQKPKHPYVRELSRDGEPHRRLWIGHPELLNTNTLRFAMGNEPDRRRYGPAELPFSISGA